MKSHSRFRSLNSSECLLPREQVRRRMVRYSSKSPINYLPPSERRLVSLTNEELKSLLKQKQKQKKTIIKEVVPSWLYQRQGFQDIVKEFDNIHTLNIAEIASKPPDTRSPAQRKAVKVWVKQLWFFKDLSPRLKLNTFNHLKPARYPKNTQILQKGQSVDKIYIVVTGTVKICPNLILGSNNSLGELDVLLKRPCSTSVYALTDVELLELDSLFFKDFLYSKRRENSSKRMTLFKQFKWTQTWNHLKLNEFSMHFAVAEFAQDEILFQMNSEPDFFFFILEGEVSTELTFTMTKTNRLPIGRKAYETLITSEKYNTGIQDYSVHQFLSQREAIENSLRQCRAFAKTPKVIVCYQSQQDLFQVLNQRDRNIIIGLSMNSPVSSEIQNKVKKKIKNKAYYFSALLNATQIQTMPTGRNIFENKTNRRNAYAASIFQRYNQSINSVLMEKQYELKLPKIK